MPTSIRPLCARPACMNPTVFLVASALLVLAARAWAQVDPEINKSVWKQKYGVLDAQMAGQPPYVGWLDQDADGDGVKNGDEFVAGTNPFGKLPGDAHFRPPAVTANPSSLSLTFPTVPGKLYGAESNATLIDAWSKGSLPGVTGDGTSKTLTVPKSAGNFFHLSVTDQATQGDQVSDWAKLVLGLSAASPITSQTSFDHTSLAANLNTQNVVSLSAADTAGTLPPDGATPAGDFGLVRITRSGFMLLGPITVPISKSGTAVEGTDYAPLPAAVTFPAGVNSLDVKITPLFNAARTSGATVLLTAGTPESAGAAGNYTLGSPASAGVTLYPSGNPSGTGLTANYYPGSSSTYTNASNFGGVSATYSYTKATATTGNAVVTYTGTPITPYAVGSQVTLQPTSGNLNTSPYNTPITYTVAAPVTSTSFKVNITGTTVPNTGTGNMTIGAFYAPVIRLDPTVDFTWGTGTPDPSIGPDNFSARWTGQVLPQYSQTYFFVARVDDGVKLWVNNQLIVTRWPGGGATDSTGSINLQGGVYYDIKMEYYEGTGNAESHLSWYSDDQAKQVVPANRLFPTIGGTAALAGNPPAAPPAVTSPTSAVAILGSGSPFSMTLAGSNGGTFTASGLPPWLALVNGVLGGTPPAAGTYQFTVTTTNAAGSGSAVITLEVLAGGNQLTRDLWTTGVTGAGLSDVPWTSPPTSSDTVAVAEDNVTSYGANTGERLRGYFIAPATGNYYFWIAAGNAAELRISNNAEPVNKVRRASVTGPAGTGARTWDTQANQKSQWLSLVAGRKYYIEALHNTGAGGAGNHLSVAWFLDPTGNTANPIANGSPPATAATGGVIPGQVISPWDNPPTTSVPGTLHVTNLQGVGGLNNITATGGAFLRVNGTAAVLQLNYSGLTSGALSRKLYNSAGRVVFDIDAQDKNYPALKTSDGGYSWNMQASDLAALDNGTVYLGIATVNHPDGEIAGTFGKIAGSQTAPAVPNYPAWADLHASSDAANSRFLSQATFGPGPADMASVKAGGYRTWIENQFATPPTRNLPYILSNLSNDPQNPYGSSLFFNSWWKNSVTAPDQLRQRAAFALSEILVVSDTGPLNNNGRTLADYYDTMLDYGFGNFRDILKQVTLSSAMGVYLDMRGNAAGNIQTGLHPNENYAREIMQLFSAGLYRTWPDGTLVLDSTASAVPTYDQSVITGMARVFTGWTWGQAMAGGRLPTNFSPSSNYLDPMVLVPAKHEPGGKILLDNVVLPPATVITQSDTSTDPGSTYTVQSTDPVLGAGNLVTTTITNKYDLAGVKDLEMALDSILNNSATGPYICRQLIQRLVTSHPKADYVHRVVRAFNGEQNVDGAATGVRGDMKEVFRAILLDYEARDSTAAADIKFGKQREPLLRVTGPARAFPAAGIANSSYRELGLQPMLITTPVPHRLGNGENVLLNTFVDAGALSARVPTTQSYSTKNTTPAYHLDGPTGITTIDAPGYQAGDTVALQFTSGALGAAAPFNTVQNYTVLSTNNTTPPFSFTINIGVTTFVGTITGNSLTPYNFTVDNNSLSSPSYSSAGNTVTVTASNYVAGQQLYLKFSSGGLLGAGFDGVYTIASAGTNFTVTLGSSPPNTGGVVLIPRLTGGYNVTTSGSVSSIALQTSGNHNLNVGDQVQIDFLVTNSGTPAQDAVYTVAGVGGPNVFSVTTPTQITNGSQGSNGMFAYPLAASPWTRDGTLTVNLSTWNIGYSQNDLNQTPLNSTTVFNFFYPDYRYPGEMARAGMTTPEFQLTNDSNTMNLTNSINGSILSGGNPNGYTGYKSGGGAVTMDFGPYMTAGQTGNAAIPALVDSIGDLLAGGNLTGAARTTIINYVANTTNFPYTTPTTTEMRNRVRAIVHLIVTSAEFAIQK